ncbi:hypothetical protein GH714_014791 [Hevea brasiliensis]|uniref:non-specific serine/threonine protein kinase n=1 Tax=Hevea brasiliensis TaxID=3981 RepID=A0A6A6M056_HEVBR|nr:hypothetical protein GH714_014791 [Hevea brasiliensis]
MFVGFSSSTDQLDVLGWSFQFDEQAQELYLSRIPSLPSKKITRKGKVALESENLLRKLAQLGRLQHHNLVPVLSYCRSKGELLLAYDHMPKGSLDKFLFNKLEDILNWNQRFKIIKDITSALTYLHEENEIVTFHRDIKASNVLLDGELNGKLGDYGLARCSKHAHDAHIVGTLGYNAPELARSGKATTSTDVYAFGVFCLEVACGRRPVEPHASPEEMIMVNWVYECLREGKILSTTDPKLDKNFNAEEVELVLKLGLICSHNLAEIGPKMSQVLKYLKGDAFLPEILIIVFKNKSTGESLIVMPFYMVLYHP